MDVSHTPNEMRRLLASEGVVGVEEYCEKLRSQSHNPDGYMDLLAEGYSALTFARSRFRVTMRDSPDLKLELNSTTIGAEVKRFRRKVQDDIDDKQMQEEEDHLILYGDTLLSEGQKAWEQVEDVVKKKCLQLWSGTANVVVILSFSSNCIEDVEVMTAVHAISESQTSDSYGELSRLNGVVFLSLAYNISRARNVYFFECNGPSVPLPKRVKQALAEITRWSMG